jgi:serine/threonine protein kinase/tetratricopeptide (TPR) repeat protein
LTPLRFAGNDDPVRLSHFEVIAIRRPTVDNPPVERNPLDALAEEFLNRRARGERPTVDEYAAAHPELAAQIRARFPDLLVGDGRLPGHDDLTGSFLGGEAGHSPAPERLGEYRIIREVGRGGMGIVYEAEQQSLGRHVALKVLASSALLDPQRVARFRREAKAAARLHHTNIVPVFGVGESAGVHYYVMQYIAGAGLDRLFDDVRRLQPAGDGEIEGDCGGDGGHDQGSRVTSLELARTILEGRPEVPEARAVSAGTEEASRPSADRVSSTTESASGLSVLSAGSGPGRSYARGVVEVGVQVAEALEYAHEQGTLHRDVKPSNILLDAHGIAWVTDFGLAKTAADDDLTHTGDIVGTVRYMAPERFHGRCDARSDVYGLGLTLYELLARRRVFDGADRNSLIHQISQSQPTRLRKLDRSIPRDLETIVHKAIEKDPAHRYATAGAMAADLRCVLEDRPIRARRATPIERIWRWSRRNVVTAALAFVAALSLLTAAVVGWAGYATTTRALAGEASRRKEAESATRRADENVALSLAVFEELFERLAPRDTLPAPTLGLSVRRSSPGPGGRPAPKAAPPGSAGRPARKKAGPPPRPKNSESDTALLRSVLVFYDRFATRNATNPTLQGEAAWAYRKVGVLNERLGRRAEAEYAYARAIGILEELVARYPDAAEYRFKLVETYDVADPWSAAQSSLPGMEQRLRRASSLIDQLANEAPANVDYAHAQIHVHAKLGMDLQRLQRSEEAETCYRRAIAFEGALLDRAPRDGRARYDRATTRHALATLLLSIDRIDEAKRALDLAAHELQTLATSDTSRRPPPDLFDRLADTFRDLGEIDRAEEMDRAADQLLTAEPPDFPNPPRRDRTPEPASGPR